MIFLIAVGNVLDATVDRNDAGFVGPFDEPGAAVHTPVIDRGDLQFDVDLIGGTNESDRDLFDLEFFPAIAKLEKTLLQRALAQSAGNRTEAARRLGINRQLLYAKLKEHGLDG